MSLDYSPSYDSSDTSDVLVDRPKRSSLDHRTLDPVEPSDQDTRPAVRIASVVFPKRGELPALQRCKCPKLARWVARILIVGLIATVILMAFAPWQQTVKGTGNVTNYDPKLRPQTIEAPISGRVVRLGEGIREMSFVKKGDLIAELADLDPLRLDRLRSQREMAERSEQSARDALEFAKSELNRTERLVEVYDDNVQTLKRAQKQSISAANVYLDVAKNTRDAASRLVNDQTAVLELAEKNFKRQEQLFSEDIASEFTYQQAKADYVSAQAKLAKTEDDLEAAERLITARERERDRITETTTADIEIASSRYEGAKASVESARAKVSTAEQTLQRAANALTELDSNVRRQENQIVTAPIDGYLVKIYTDAGSSVVTQGSPIARIVPKSSDRVVQIWLDGNDATLVQPGDHVRLQFEGWPAIQFAGWPSVAVGTFGGEVISVDATDDGTSGMFRMLVKEVSGEDPETGLVEEPWPEGRFLRPGVRANAWVLLEVVDLWWEVWRNLNGFPPVVDVEGEDSEKEPKKPKLPKL